MTLNKEEEVIVLGKNAGFDLKMAKLSSSLIKMGIHGALTPSAEVRAPSSAVSN